jgi:hypothetical protein
MSGVHSPLRLLLSSLHPSALVSQRLWSACLVVSNVGVGRDAPRLVASEQLGRRSPSRLLLELEVSDGEAGVGFLGGQDGGKLRAKDIFHERRGTRSQAIPRYLWPE